MSVYNGHKYLKEQIDSILNQVDVDKIQVIVIIMPSVIRMIIGKKIS